MSSVVDRFMRYISIDTQSSETSGLSPSTEKQKVLGRLLRDELAELGAEDIYYDEEHNYLYAMIPATDGGRNEKVLGFIAHMDTSPEASGENVNPQFVYDYDGGDIVTDNGNIRPCVGCFSCWNRDPGRCAIKDGYDNMGVRIHHADEVVVISRYTYGGFSGSVKNVFDRCLGYVLPQFEIAGGETHHQKRYDEDKPFTFIFYGHKLSEDEKNSAVRYVTAVCANIRGHVNDVIFRECEEIPVPERTGGRRKKSSGENCSCADTSA